MDTPQQFSTAAGTLSGLVDDGNTIFSFVPDPATLLFANPVPGIISSLYFVNGVLTEVPGAYDFRTGAGYLTPGQTIGSDVYTGILFPLSVTSGITRFTPSQVTPSLFRIETSPFLLFRNNLLLTPGLNYTVNGPWVSTAVTAGDVFTGFYGLRGSLCSTYAGTITGAIDGSNTTFVLPANDAALLFLNGKLLTSGTDYTRLGASVVLRVAPTSGVLAAQIYSGAVPVQISSADGSLTLEVASASMTFRNGLRMTPPRDVIESGNSVMLAGDQTPYGDDIVTVTAWTADQTDPSAPPLNLPVRFSTDDGTIVGNLDGENQLYLLLTDNLVTDMILTWNGDYMTEDIDYSFSCQQPTSAGPWVTQFTMLGTQIANEGDTLTAGVFFS